MSFVWRHIPPLRGVFLALLFATATACIFPVIGSAFGGVALFSHQPMAEQSHAPVLHVEVDLRAVDVQVKDSQGNDVLGLSARDFTVLENGKRQKIAFFDAGNGPVSLAVLVDSSDSMYSYGRLGSAQAVAAQFMHTARPQDEVWAMDFTDQMGTFQHLSREQFLNPSLVALAPVPSGGSALYDAIATALCHLRASKNPRQAVIVITDGVDQHSRITLDQLIGLVRSSRAQLFMIGLQSRPGFHLEGHIQPRLTLITGHDIDNPAIVFNRLMKESGAESFIPNSRRGLKEALKAVSDTLQSEYTLAYYPEEAATKFRKIKVKVDRPGVRVLVRQFVGSYREAAEFVHFEKGTCTVSPKFHPYAYESETTHGPGGMTYREDFTDPRSGWPNHKDSHYVSGGYELLNAKVKATNAALMPHGFSRNKSVLATFRQNVIAAYGRWWRDFRASAIINVALQPLSRKANAKSPQKTRSAAGLLFRMNLQGYYAMLISRASAKRELSVELVKREFENNSYRQMEIVPWITVAQASASRIRLSVEAIGDQISMFVNGKEIKTVRDDAFDQGLVGFVISGPGRAIFRNLVVEQK